MNTATLDTPSDSLPTPEGILYEALRRAFARQALEIKLNSFGTGDCYTHLSRHSRSAQVFTGFGRHDFRLDFSEGGSMLAKGATPEFERAVEALVAWLSGANTVEEFVAQHASCDIRRARDVAP